MFESHDWGKKNESICLACSSGVPETPPNVCISSALEGIALSPPGPAPYKIRLLTLSGCKRANSSAIYEPIDQPRMWALPMPSTSNNPAASLASWPIVYSLVPSEEFPVPLLL